MIEWPYVGAEQSQTKYSPVDEITAANVGELEIVWRWEPNETPFGEYGTRPGPFQATPVMVGNVFYLSTMYNWVAALDAESRAPAPSEGKVSEQRQRKGVNVRW